MLTFETYCAAKKIDAVLFMKHETPLFNELKDVFKQMHPESFTVQKKFLINALRRKFQLKETLVKEVVKSEVTKPKVVIPKIAVKQADEATLKPTIPKSITALKPKIVIPSKTTSVDTEKSEEPVTPKKSALKPMIPKKKIE